MATISSKNLEDKPFPAYMRLLQEELVKNDLIMKSTIQDIRQCKGPESRLEQLNYDIRKIVKDLKHNIEKLENMAKEEDRESDENLILKEVDRFNKELSSNFVELRKANIASQLAIDRDNQEMLFKYSDGEPRKRQQNRDGLVKVSSRITESLQSLTHRMAEQVAQSEQTMSTLVGTSTNIDETHEEYHGMSGVIQQSRKLLTKYNRREITDKIVIFLAIAFFFACVLYVLMKRIL